MFRSPICHKRTPLLFLLLILFANTTQLFASDTLLYRSPFEARLIAATINKSNTDYLALYLAINSDSATYATHAATLNRFFLQLDKKVSSTKAGKQKARVIFKEVHDSFFNQYEEKVLLSEIFTKGIYNCLTASMLYALVLDRYDIPYEIKEKPTHVYLVAFPGTDNIMFETTNPKGLYIPDDKAKREFVSGLVSMKFTTQEYVNSVGISQAFNEFFYNNENISLQQLGGLQYYNQTIGYIHTDIDAAITSIRKAEMLYPSTVIQYLKRALIIQVVSNSEFDSLKDIRYLAEYANSVTDTQDKKRVLATFGELLETKLLKNSEEAFVTGAHNIMVADVKDEKLRKDIDYQYEHAMVYWLEVKGDRAAALIHAEKAYALNSNDVRLQEMILHIIANKSERQLSKGEAIEILDGYAEKFSFLKTNEKFQLMMVYQYALKSYGLFMKNSATEGYKYMGLMEQQLKIIGGNAIGLEQLTGLVYAEAGAYHFRQKDYNKARSILNKGLEHNPDHSEIKERLRIVNEEIEARPR